MLSAELMLQRLVVVLLEIRFVFWYIRTASDANTTLTNE